MRYLKFIPSAFVLVALLPIGFLMEQRASSMQSQSEADSIKHVYASQETLESDKCVVNTSDSLIRNLSLYFIHLKLKSTVVLYLMFLGLIGFINTVNALLNVPLNRLTSRLPLLRKLFRLQARPNSTCGSLTVGPMYKNTSLR